jgi:hypothetical protein
MNDGQAAKKENSFRVNKKLALKDELEIDVIA